IVPADARVEFDGRNTTETGERRKFETPPLVVGKEYTYGVTVAFRGKVVKRDITVSHKGQNSFDLRPEFVAAGSGNPEADAAFQKRGEEFIAAFNKGDASALAGFFTSDADYVDQAGNTLSGRKAIEAAFEKQFAARKDGRLRIDTTAL